MAQVLKETHLNPQHFLSYRDTVADPDLQIRGGSHPYPEIRWGPSLRKVFFQLFGPHFGLKIRGAWAPRAPPLDPPLGYNVFCYSQPKGIHLLAFYPSMCVKP